MKAPEAIRKARMTLGLTQKQLAKEMGVFQSNLSFVENGKTSPSLEYLERVAKAVGGELHVEIKIKEQA